MHGRSIRFLALFWFIAATLLSQDSSSGATKIPPLTPDSGTFEKGVYTNVFFHVSYTPGADWFLNEEQLEANKQAPKPPGLYFLLVADRRTETPIRERILLMAEDTSKYHSVITLENFVRKMAHALVRGSQMELTRDAYPEEFAGQHFYRTDYKENWSGGTLYKTFTAFEHKGFFLCWTFAATSKERLDGMVNSLGTLAFAHQTIAKRSQECRSMHSTVPSDLLACTGATRRCARW